MMKVDASQLVTVDHELLRGADFSGRKLLKFCSIGSRFERCRFDKMRIERAEGGSFGAGRETSEYIDCSFDGARIRMGPGGYARFVRCSFRDVDLRSWQCFMVELIDCAFSGRLSKSWFNGTVSEEDRPYVGREHNEFHGNDFSSMKLVEVSFRTGIDLAQQRLPTGPEYLYIPEAADAVQMVRAQVIRWDDLEVRRLAMAMIKVWEDSVAAGQRQLFFRPADFHSVLGEDVVGAVCALLRDNAEDR